MSALTVGELQVLLSGDMSRLNRDMDRIDSRAGQTERTHSAAWGRIGAAAGAAIRGGMLVATGAVVGLGAAIKQGLNMASFTEQAEISFGTLLGSADKAKTYLGDLQKFAAATPFELPGVVEGAQKLLGVGAAAETVIPTLTAWGDASGALGLTQDQFGRTLTAVTQMMGKGKVSAEEMLQITEAGIPIWMLLAKATGKPVPELQKLASEGKLLAEDVLPLLEKQMNADYGGSMAKQAGTLTGVWSTAKDNMNLALRDGVKPLAEGLKTVLPSASASAATAIRELGLRGSEGLLVLIKRGQELGKEFGPELAQIGEMAAKKWGQFTDLLRDLGSEVAPSLPDLVDNLLRIAQVGAEVGEAMLPALHAGLKLAGPAADALAGALGIVADVLETIEPILPIVVGGLLAFKGISAVSGVLGTFQASLGTTATRMSNAAINAGVFTEKMTGSAVAGERVMSSMGRVGSAVSKVGAALPIVGIALGLVGAAMERTERQVDGWAQALLDGGSAAQVARDEMRQTAADAEDMASGWKGAAASLLGFGGVVQQSSIAAGDASKIASERSRELYESMSPLQQANQDVTTATNNLSQAQKDHGVSSQQAAIAADVLRTAQTNLETKQRDLEGATRTATDALLAQTQAAIAGANADLAASMANTQLSTTMETYNASLADGTLTATQHQQATDAMTQSAFGAAQAAAAQAFAHSTAATDELKQRDADAALLASLRTTAQQLGSNTPAAISQLIASLEKSAGSAGLTAQGMRDLGLSVHTIPGNKTIFIDAPTAEQKARLEGLGYTIRTLPNGQVYVTADTSPAAGTLAAFMNQRRTIQLEAIVSTGAARTALGGLGGGGGVQARASGGPVGARTPYIVGEEGQELFVPNVPGTIIDAKKTAALLAAAGNRRAAAMLPGLGAGAPARGMSLSGGSAGTGSASVAGVNPRSYTFNGYLREEMSDKRFMELAERAEWLHG